MTALVLAMLVRLLPALPSAHANHVAAELASALVHTPQIDPALAVAILYEESKGNPRACRNDAYGGSSRGLMQIRVPGSHCGDWKRRDLYDVRKNVREGVKILAMLKQKYAGDLERMLRQYSGGAHGYADRIRATIGRLR
ncbi:MAG: hypothetical protein PVSMB8_00080 [Vulcanimicrobiaceae bacterium]